MSSRKGVDLLMLRNSLFRLRNIKKWAVSSLTGTDLLMLRISVFKAWKRSYMGSVVVQGGRFHDVHDLRFHTAKRLDMGCAELKDCLFANFQE